MQTRRTAKSTTSLPMVNSSNSIKNGRLNPSKTTTIPFSLGMRPKTADSGFFSTEALKTPQSEKLNPPITNLETIFTSNKPQMLPRPSTAISKHAKSHPTISIRNLVDSTTETRPTGDAMIESMEEQLEKQVEQRRTKYDRIHFGVQKRQEKIEKMHQTLVDLEKQAEHLGLNYNSRSGTNKKPTKSISRRPIHVNTQRLSDLERRIEEKNKAIEYSESMKKVYDHMKQRLYEEMLNLERQQRELKELFKQEKMKQNAAKKEEIASAERQNRIEQELEKFKSYAQEEIDLWKKEIQDRRNFVQQKHLFIETYEKQMEKHNNLDSNLNHRLRTKHQKELKAKHWVSGIVVQHITSKLLHQREEMEHEEKRCAEMFARIGVDMKDVDPQQVTDKCLRYDYIRRDLDQRANSLEQKLEGLKNTMKDTEENLRQRLNNAENTTNRLIMEREKILEKYENYFKRMKEEYSFVSNQIVKPVKIGLIQLFTQVLHIKKESLETPEEVEQWLETAEKRLRDLINTSSAYSVSRRRSTIRRSLSAIKEMAELKCESLETQSQHSLQPSTDNSKSNLIQSSSSPNRSISNESKQNQAKSHGLAHKPPLRSKLQTLQQSQTTTPDPKSSENKAHSNSSNEAVPRLQRADSDWTLRRKSIDYSSQEAEEMYTQVEASAMASSMTFSVMFGDGDTAAAKFIASKLDLSVDPNKILPKSNIRVHPKKTDLPILKVEDDATLMQDNTFGSTTFDQLKKNRSEESLNNLGATPNTPLNSKEESQAENLKHLHIVQLSQPLPSSKGPNEDLEKDQSQASLGNAESMQTPKKESYGSLGVGKLGMSKSRSSADRRYSQSTKDTVRNTFRALLIYMKQMLI